MLLQTSALPFEDQVPNKKRIDSPSTVWGRCLLDDRIATLCDWPPLSIASRVDCVEWPLLEGPIQTPACLVEEKQFYSVATRFVPSWVEVVGARTSSSTNMSAAALHPASEDVYKPLHFTVPWRCEPELFTRAKEKHPGFNGGELKSCEKTIYNEVLTYVVLDMLSSLFPDNGKLRFYSTPPIGYGLIGFPHIGYFVALEWIGKLFMTPVSKPFLLGSEDHRAAVEALEDVHFDDFVEVAASGGLWHHVDDWADVLVKYCAQAIDKRFYKIIFCKKFDSFGKHGAAMLWRDLYRTYAQYAEAVTNSSNLPASLVPAQLRFGVGAVLVDMEWVEGEEADEDWDEDDQLVLQVASAIVWLAQNKLLYCDPRPPNILINNSSAYLIDYDDMVVVEEVPSSFEQFKLQLEEVAGKRGQDKARFTLSFQAAPKLLKKVDELLQQGSPITSMSSVCVPVD
ncbi:MAG: hypothetical protein SGPRY_013455, partial [Prymnesium sp.]